MSSRNSGFLNGAQVYFAADPRFDFSPGDTALCQGDREWRLLALARGHGGAAGAGRRFLEVLGADWLEGRSSRPSRRLYRAFQVAAADFQEREQPDPEELVSPCLTAAVVVVGRVGVHGLWIGGERTWLIRRGRPLTASTPHTLAYQLGIAQAPNAVQKTISAGPCEPSRLRWSWRPGDEVWLTNSFFPHRCRFADWAGLAEGWETPEQLRSRREQAHVCLLRIRRT